MSVGTHIPYYDLTLDDVKGRLRESLATALEQWAPNHVTDGRVSDYTAWLDRVEGEFQMPDGTWVLLCIGSAEDAPEYRALRRLAKQVAQEVG